MLLKKYFFYINVFWIYFHTRFVKLRFVFVFLEKVVGSPQGNLRVAHCSVLKLAFVRLIFYVALELRSISAIFVVSL